MLALFCLAGCIEKRSVSFENHIPEEIIDNDTAAHDPEIIWVKITIKPERHKDQSNFGKDRFSEFMKSIVTSKCQWKKNKYKYVRIK